MLSIANVFETNDYSIFKALENNREVTDARANKIKSSFLEGEVLNPIIVNENMEVIDGQGRLAAKIALNRPVQYIIVPGLTIKDCQRLNKYTTKWTAMDFINSYANSGNENYIILRKAMLDSGMGSRRVMRLANHSYDQHNSEDVGAVERGAVKFSEDDYKKVMDTCNYAKLVVDALAEHKRQNDAFYTGLSIIMATKGFDRQRFIENCKKCRGSYVQASNIGNQLKEYSRIYNFKRSPQNRIYFEDYMRNKGWSVRDYSEKEVRDGM